MTKNKPTQTAKSWASGHEKGSVAASMNKAQMREFKAWLAKKNRDSHAYERQMRTISGM